jgi:iron only hydrogenase large subunit-like protein
VAHSSSKEFIYDATGKNSTLCDYMNDKDTFAVLPQLSSHCPGWVCYAEKSQPECVPYLSRVKSAQQILGSVLKRLFSGVEQRWTHADIPIHSKPYYIVSIQPCFDKKLEASRKVS